MVASGLTFHERLEIVRLEIERLKQKHKLEYEQLLHKDKMEQLNKELQIAKVNMKVNK